MPFTVPWNQADSYYITRVRRAIRDEATWFTDTIPTDGVQGATVTAGSKPFRLKRAPVVGAGAVVTLNGINQPVVYDANPASPGVEIVTETGELIFAAVPINGQNILATYQAYRFSDTQIVEALRDGLWQLWPDIWLPATDTSLIYSPAVTEYTLPAAFGDPRVQIISFEMQPPNGILVSVPTGRYRRQALTNLIVQRVWPAGSVMRITYNSPYVNLADLEQQASMLPVYYAAYLLLTEQDSMRTRQNDLAALSGDGTSASAPDIASKMGQLWLQKFEALRTRLAMQQVVREDAPDRTVEHLEAGRFSWNPL